ncbi:hypothetical protein BSP109_01057 [Brevibacterium sp. Mu109]|uniref:hypothetical protein n=1 Tax=Brevibacterium sp. Mu109 TaxID=1255669 RepID=UPI000C4D2BA8|nr:hypothetical protein [Brevibacterium sp. Mu109]SMX73989.1 hypothetical protein BSP109_01057 [Brevibacterium sp. Mu109]
MPPPDSRPFWGAALAAALVAAPALAAIAIPPGGAAAQTASAGTLTVGWGDTGFGWSDKDDEPHDAAGSVLTLDDGRAGLSVVPHSDGDTEQPYPLSLRGVTAHPVDGQGRIGETIDVDPLLSIDEVPREVEAMDQADRSLLTPRRLADSGLPNSSGSAFDIDHALHTEWSFLIPSDAMSAETAQADTRGGIAYCVAVETGSVRTAQNGTAEGHGAQSVLTFRDEDMQLEPMPEPTRPAPTPTTLPTGTPSPVPPADEETPGLRDGETAGGLGSTTDEEPGLQEPANIPSAIPPTVDPGPDPTFTANPPTAGPTEPAPTEPAPDPTFTANPPTLEPTEVPTDEPTEEPGDATSCAETDGAGETDDRGVGAPEFVHGSTQDAITTQVDADGEPYFQVPAPQHANPAAEVPVAQDLTGPGLDLGVSLISAHSLGFRLTAAPEDGAVTYRNQTEDGAFADRGHAHQRMLLDRDVQVEHRWAPTRDAHASWSFTERGVYCVAYAVDGPRARALDTAPGTSKGLSPDDVLRFVVGDADPTSVDCARESEDAVISFPADDDGDGDDDGGDGDGPGDDDGVGDDDGSEGGLGGDDDDEDGDRGGLDGGDRDDDSSEGGMDGRSDDEDDDEDETRVVAAPASAAVCPADGQVPRQLRDGDFALALTDDGMRVTDVATDATVPNGSSVVVGDTSRRTGAAGIDGFVAPGAQYLATGSTGAPSFTWSAGGFDEPLDLQIEQTDGDGQVRVFLGEGTGVSADGGRLTVEPESSGTLLFGFDQPGEYAVTLSDGGDREVELEFVAGDRYASAQAGTMMNTLFSTCPDVSWTTDLLTAQQSETAEDSEQSDGAQAQQQTGSGLGRGWWGLAGAGMTLAGLLLVAILVVVMREARR